MSYCVTRFRNSRILSLCKKCVFLDILKREDSPLNNGSASINSSERTFSYNDVMKMLLAVSGGFTARYLICKIIIKSHSEVKTSALLPLKRNNKECKRNSYTGDFPPLCLSILSYCHFSYLFFRILCISKVLVTKIE